MTRPVVHEHRDTLLPTLVLDQEAICNYFTESMQVWSPMRHHVNCWDRQLRSLTGDSLRVTSMSDFQIISALVTMRPACNRAPEIKIFMDLGFRRQVVQGNLPSCIVCPIRVR